MTGSGRIEGELFVFDCTCGGTTDAQLTDLARVAKEEDTVVITCWRPNCDKVFELSDEFAEKLRQAAEAAEAKEATHD